MTTFPTPKVSFIFIIPLLILSVIAFNIVFQTESLAQIETGTVIPALSPSLDTDGNPAVDIVLVNEAGQGEYAFTVTQALLNSSPTGMHPSHGFEGNFNGASVYMPDASTVQLVVGPDEAGLQFIYTFELATGQLLSMYTYSPA